MSQPPPSFAKLSWWTLFRIIWIAKRDNKKSSNLYGYGKISVDTRYDQIEYFEGLMMFVFMEMYRRIFNRPYRAGYGYRPRLEI